MIVCVCKGVSDRQIRNLICQGAASVHAVGRGCAAGTDCGACVQQIRCMIEGADRSEQSVPWGGFIPASLLAATG